MDAIDAQVDIDALREAFDRVGDALSIVRAVRDGDGAIVDYRMEYVNRQATDILGRGRDELTGGSIREQYPELDPAVLAAYARVVETGEPLTLPALDYTVQLPDGGTRTASYELHASKLGDGLVLTWHELKGGDARVVELEAARRDAEQRYRSLIDADVIGIISGEDDRILEANGAFLRMLGLTADDLEARRLRWTDLTPPEAADRNRAIRNQALSTGRVEPWELELLDRAGRRVPVLVGGALVSSDPYRWVGFVEDLTERREVEASLRRREGRARATAAVAAALADLRDDISAAFEQVVTVVAGQLGDSAIAGLLDPEGSTLRPVALHHDDPEALAVLRAGLEEGVPFGPGLVGDALMAGEPVVVGHDQAVEFAAEAAPAFRGFLAAFALEAAVVTAMRGRGEVRGLLAVGRRAGGAPFTPGDVAFLQDIADRCGLALLNEQLLVEREQAARQLLDLQRITDVTLGQMSSEHLIRELLVRIRDVLDVETVRILLVQPDGRSLAAGGALGFPEADDTPVPIGEGVAGRIALAEGPVVFEDLRGVPVVSRLLRDARLASLAGVPLRSGDRLVGVLHVGSRSHRTFEAQELDLLQRAADRIAVAIDRARLYEAEQAARERLGFLADLSVELTGSLDREEVMRRITQAAVPRLGDWCIIQLAEPGAALPAIEVASRHPGAVEQAHAILRRLAAHPDSAVPRVLRSGRTEHHGDLDRSTLEALGADEDLIEIIEGLRIHAAIIVPLCVRDHAIGVLQFLRIDTEVPFNDDDVRLAEEVASRAAAVLDNVRLYEEQREIARLLQASLLPSAIPAVPGVDVAVRYWAAGAGNEVGGDFYDLFDNGDGTWGIVIGDVCGKGPRAATLTGLARHTLRSGARHAADPSTVLEWLNEAILVDHRDLYCTGVFARLGVGEHAPADQPDGAQLVLSVAGHPPPVVVHADGTAEELGVPGNPLGMFEHAVLHTRHHDLAPGDTVVFYTDGVTDAPPPDWVGPDELLAMAARSASGSATADETADRFGQEIERIRPLPERRDDIAVLVLRVTGAWAIETVGPMRLRLDPADPVPVRTARAAFAAWGAAAGLPPSDAEALLLVVSELAANAVEASPDGAAELVAELLLGAEANAELAGDDRHDLSGPVVEGPVVTLVVENRTHGPVPVLGRGLPAPDAVHGRGLYVVGALCDRLAVEVSPAAGDTVVRVTATRRIRG